VDEAQRSVKINCPVETPGAIKGNDMPDIEWVKKGLSDFQKDELAEIERVKKAYAALEAAKKELADAKESLKGTRGCIAEMEWQLEYYKEHGKLP